MSQHISIVNRPSLKHKYTIIIPSAGCGRRMKSHGPKSLIELKNGNTILQQQLRNIHKNFRFYVVKLSWWVVLVLIKSTVNYPHTLKGFTIPILKQPM